MSERLGFIGLGAMGAPMALRLVKAGEKVSVWNRSAGKIAPLAAAGARAAADPAQVMSQSDVVHLCVFDDAAVEEVAFGPRGLAAAGPAAGKLVVDHSSIPPEAARRIAVRLKEATGAGWVDAPVSGGVGGAQSGKLVIMAGGEAADIERLRPILAHMAQRTTHMGPVGAGQVTKLCNQMLVGCTLGVVAEALRLAANGGVDVASIPGALAGGYADSVILQQHGPLMMRGKLESKSMVATILKDLDNACAFAAASKTSIPVTTLTAELYRLLYAQKGGEHDGLGIMRLFADRPLIV